MRELLPLNEVDITYHASHEPQEPQQARSCPVATTRYKARSLERTGCKPRPQQSLTVPKDMSQTATQGLRFIGECLLNGCILEKALPIGRLLYSSSSSSMITDRYRTESHRPRVPRDL